MPNTAVTTTPIASKNVEKTRLRAERKEYKRSERRRLHQSYPHTQAFETAELSNFGRAEMDKYENSLKIYRDLKNVINTAYGEGQSEGFEAGFETGVETGEERGFAKDIDIGIEKGKQEENWH